jgi:hypothetical protein
VIKYARWFCSRLLCSDQTLSPYSCILGINHVWKTHSHSLSQAKCGRMVKWSATGHGDMHTVNMAEKLYLLFHWVLQIYRTPVQRRGQWCAFLRQSNAESVRHWHWALVWGDGFFLKKNHGVMGWKGAGVVSICHCSPALIRCWLAWPQVSPTGTREADFICFLLTEC